MRRCNGKPSQRENLGVLRPECRRIMQKKAHVVEEQRNADLDPKYDEIKARPAAAINYN